jgi:hypothetical protein
MHARVGAIGGSLKRFALAVLKRLLVSIAVLLVLAGSGYVYATFIGRSSIAASCILLLVAWPWALPQIFILVSLFWFIGQCARHWVNST